MRVLILERNLLWSSRLMKTLEALGHEAAVAESAEKAEEADADVAIVNLSDPNWDPRTLVPALKARSQWVIGHAGHKEKDLHRLGKEVGCDAMATNSQLTFKLAELLDQVQIPGL